MEKYAVLTITTNDFWKEVSQTTHPSIDAYAKKIGAERVNITHPNSNYITQKWLKFEIYNLLNKYNRIIYFDTDIIVRPDTPNLFEKVPEDKLGMVIESRYISRAQEIFKASETFGIKTDWEGKYYNAGVIVASRRQKQLFRIPDKHTDDFDDPTAYLNLQIAKSKTSMQDLDWRFCRTSYMDEEVGMTRHDSYVIHYQNAPENQLIPIIHQDLKQWMNDAPEYKYQRKIVVSVSAGMGDQLCAEPAVRYMINHIYKDADVSVVTHHPRLFSHLPLKVMDYNDYETYQKQGKVTSDTLILYSCPSDEKSKHQLSHVMFHPTDFATMSMYKQAIPIREKDIKLEVYHDDFANLLEITGGDSLKDLIVVHAGKWWASKTFPTDWWQEIIDKITATGQKVALIGKTIDEKQGYQPVICPEGSYDFRDLTSLSEMIALISEAKITLTNDSSPIHIAGAFDNWLICMPSAKHPDHILPYRKGSQYYKTKALYKKLTIDSLRTNYLMPETDNIDTYKGNIYDFIPDVDTVVNEVLSVCKEIEETKPKKKK